MLVLFTASVVALFLADLAYVNGASIREVLTSTHIRQAFLFSMTSSLLAAALSIVVAIPAAYALSRYPFRGIIILDTIVDLLIVLPVLVIGVSILVFFRFGSQMAESHFLLARLAGAAIAACGEFFIYTKAGVVLAQFFCSVSFAVRIVKSAFDDIDPRTEQVAMTLGCTRAGAFRRVTLPLARHGIMAGTALSWARAFGVYGAIAIVGGAVRGKTEVLPTSVYLEISIGRLEVAIAISLVMIAVATVVLITLRLISGKTIFGTGGV